MSAVHIPISLCSSYKNKVIYVFPVRLYTSGWFYLTSRNGNTLSTGNSWVARDVTKNQTKKLSILLSFYFHEVLQYLNIFT